MPPPRRCTWPTSASPSRPPTTSRCEAQSPLLHFWTLGVEEQFYLFWPLHPAGGGALPVAALRRASSCSSWRLASFALSLSGPSTLPQWAFFSPLTRAWELAAGALIAVGLCCVSQARTATLAALVCVVVGLALIVVSVVHAQRRRPRSRASRRCCRSWARSSSSSAAWRARHACRAPAGEPGLAIPGPHLVLAVPVALAHPRPHPHRHRQRRPDVARRPGRGRHHRRSHQHRAHRAAVPARVASSASGLVARSSSAWPLRSPSAWWRSS